MLTTLLFTLPPLLAIRKIRPAIILRRDMPDAKLPWRKRLERRFSGPRAGGGRNHTSGNRVLIAAWLSESPRGSADTLPEGLLISLLLLAAVASLLLRGIREVLRGAPRGKLPTLTRQVGLARLGQDLHRQGNQAKAILVALGFGVMFTLSVYLVQKAHW